MPDGFRETLQFYLIDCKTALGKTIDISIIVLNLFVCAILVIETYPVSEATRQLLWKMEVIIVLFFIIEYAARLYAPKSRFKQLVDIFRIFRFLRFTADPVFFFGSLTLHVLEVARLFLTIFMIFFISSGLFFYVESGINADVRTFGDAFYFTVVALTTVGFGDITPMSTGGRWVTVLMILSGITLIPWQVSRIVREWVHMASKKEIICPGCGLRYHDKEASHCKSCGHLIYQKYAGD